MLDAILSDCCKYPRMADAGGGTAKINADLLFRVAKTTYLTKQAYALASFDIGKGFPDSKDWTSYGADRNPEARFVLADVHLSSFGSKQTPLCVRKFTDVGTVCCRPGTGELDAELRDDKNIGKMASYYLKLLSSSLDGPDARKFDF